MAARKKVQPGQEFVFCTGDRAKTVAECRTILQSLSDTDFAYHVYGERNDIYAWIKDCLDPALARRIQEIRDREQLIQALKPPRR